MAITEPGIYAIGAAAYHADPAPAPSLSSSVIRDLLSRSPYHVWYSHPKLNAADLREDDEQFDLGTAAHAYLLEGESGFVIIDAPDFRTKAAREQRDAAYDAGKVPLLQHRWAAVMAMATEATRQLMAHEDPPQPLSAGRPERTLIWQENGVWCRARLDWLHDDHSCIDDLKSTRVPANPEIWSRLLFRMQYDVQAAWYLRGLKAVTGKDAIFRFVVLENTAPYRLSVLGLAPSALALAQRKVAHALAIWRYCLETDRWPAYPTRTCWAEAPAWAEAQQLERELEDDPHDDGRPLAEQMFDGGAR